MSDILDTRTWGAAFRARRVARGLSRSASARLLGVSVGTIRNWEEGHVPRCSPRLRGRVREFLEAAPPAAEPPEFASMRRRILLVSRVLGRERPQGLRPFLLSLHAEVDRLVAEMLAQNGTRDGT